MLVLVESGHVSRLIKYLKVFIDHLLMGEPKNQMQIKKNTWRKNQTGESNPFVYQLNYKTLINKPIYVIISFVLYNITWF